MADSKMLPFKIREATLQDAEGIAKVHVQSWQETYRGHLEDELLNRLSVDSRTIMWTDSMNTVEADKHLFVAEIGNKENNEIVAFISGGKRRTEEIDQNNTSTISTELYAIYCLNKFQGLNIGKGLVKVLVDEFVKVGHKEMLVWVLTSNPSKHFYMHLGASFHVEKELMIAAKPYQEQAYVWTSLQDLQKLLQQDLQSI